MDSPYLLLPGPAAADPFPHFQVAPAIREDLCTDLLGYLTSAAPWTPHHGSFYDQLECNLLANRPTGSAGQLFTSEALAGLRSAVALWFGVVLDGPPTVIAHKLLPGYRIDVHSDEPGFGMETHRLVLQMTPPGESCVGGELV